MLDGNSDAIDGVRNDQEPFSSAQTAHLAATIRVAEDVAKVKFVTFIGRLPEARKTALNLHAQLAQSDDAVLVAVDPHSRGLEIVVGSKASFSIDDRACQLAALSMTSRFVVGDLVNGLRDGIAVMGDHAHPNPVLHADLPENA